jgi:hypothetical protein
MARRYKKAADSLRPEIHTRGDLPRRESLSQQTRSGNRVSCLNNTGIAVRAASAHGFVALQIWGTYYFKQLGLSFTLLNGVRLAGELYV